MAITVIVTTWGHPTWKAMGEHTAQRNAAHAFHVDTSHLSAGEARNTAVHDLDPQDWICFLDADDHLGFSYVNRMTRAIVGRDSDPTLLFAPALALGNSDARCLDDRDIINGWNPCPIGTVIHRTMFDAVAGFWDEPAWEDWSLFRRCVLAGAEIVFVPDAVYLASFNTSGRNSTVINPLKLRRDILRSHAEWLKS